MRISTEEKAIRQRAATQRWREKNKDKLPEFKKRWSRNRGEGAIENSKRRVARWYAKPESRIRKESYRVQRQFNIPTREEAEQLVRKREAGICECCGVADVPRHLMHIDHCHKTGAIRGILCFHCNLVLGHVGESAEHMHKILAYIANWK